MQCFCPWREVSSALLSRIDQCGSPAAGSANSCPSPATHKWKHFRWPNVHFCHSGDRIGRRRNVSVGVARRTSPGKYDIGRAAATWERWCSVRETHLPSLEDGSLLWCEVIRGVVFITRGWGWGQAWVSEGSANSLKLSAGFGVCVSGSSMWIS